MRSELQSQLEAFARYYNDIDAHGARGRAPLQAHSARAKARPVVAWRSSGSTSSSQDSRGSWRSRAAVSSFTCLNTRGTRHPNTLLHLNVFDIDAVTEEFGIPVDEGGLAGREVDLEDPDGNRLRIATPRHE